MAPASQLARRGFFGEPTATIDWCEENYEISYYVAEFWNTLSNLGILLPAIFGLIDARRQRLEERFMIGFLSVIVIGVGSTLFHMTLMYEMQLLDEIPMIYGTAVIGYCLHEIKKPIHHPNWKLAVFLVVYCLAFTVSYLILKEPLIHEIMFILLAVGMAYLAFWMNVNDYCPKCVRLFAGGVVLMLVGGVLWNLDNTICPQLTALRTKFLPRILSPLTQLHAWWHFCSGFSIYVLIVAFIGYRLKYLKREFDISLTLLGPVIRIRDDQTVKAE